MACVPCACEGTDSREEKMSATFGKDGKREGVNQERMRYGCDRAKKKKKKKAKPR